MANTQEHEDNSSLFKIAMNLALACLLSGLIIACTYTVTAPIAEQKRIELQNQAMKDIVTAAQTFQPVSGKDGWYAAVNNGKIIAYVLPAESKGYGGAIKMLAAVTPDGKVLAYKILQHNETPGLGDRAGDSKFKQQFVGKTAGQLEVVKVPTDNNIQALTGATITSRAVTKGIKEAVEQVTAYAAGQIK